MALPLANGADGGTDGTLVSSANSGGASGDPFDVVATGTIMRYAVDQSAHGGMAYRIPQGATFATGNLEWTASIGGAQATLWGRAYYRFSSVAPSANMNLIRWASGGTNCANLRINTTGTIQFTNASGVAAGTASAALSADTWYRIEYTISFSTTAGSGTANIYLLDDTTPVTSTTCSGQNFATASATTVRTGNIAAGATNMTTWIDDVQVNNTGFPGPVAAPPPPAVSGTVSITGGGTVTGSGAKGGQGAAAVTGGGAVAAAGAKGSTGAVSVTGGGTVVMVGRKGGRSTVAVTGGGIVSTTGRKGGQGAVSVTGGGTVSVVAVQPARGPVVISGGGTVNVVGRKGARAAPVLTGGGTVTVVGRKGARSAVSVTGGGAVTLTAAKATGAAVTVSGGGRITFVGLGSIGHGRIEIHPTSRHGRVSDERTGTLRRDPLPPGGRIVR